MWGLRIEGRIVRMRPIAEAELPLLMDWSADAEVQHFTSIHHAWAPGEAKEWWEKAGTDPSAFHWGLEWEGRLVGRSAILRIDWQAGNAWTATMIGDRSVWRHGIATESMALRTEYAFRQLNLHKLRAAYADGNVGSAEALRRAGYREVARFKEQLYRHGRWFDDVWTEVLREDWDRQHPLT